MASGIDFFGSFRRDARHLLTFPFLDDGIHKQDFTIGHSWSMAGHVIMTYFTLMKSRSILPAPIIYTGWAHDVCEVWQMIAWQRRLFLHCSGSTVPVFAIVVFQGQKKQANIIPPSRSQKVDLEPVNSLTTNLTPVVLCDVLFVSPSMTKAVHPFGKAAVVKHSAVTSCQAASSVQTISSNVLLGTRLVEIPFTVIDLQKWDFRSLEVPDACEVSWLESPSWLVAYRFAVTDHPDNGSRHQARRHCFLSPTSRTQIAAGDVTSNSLSQAIRHMSIRNSWI